MKEQGKEMIAEKRKTILVVDDEPDVGEVISDRLKTKGYAVVQTTSGEEGWREYKKAKPDLVCLDVWMPEVDGWTLLSWIRKEDTATPVIIVTGSSSPKTVRKTFEYGADGYILKPFEFDELLQHIKEIFRRNSLELEVDRLRGLVTALTQENESLKKRLSKEDKATGKDTEKYRAICGAVAHDLKGEFLHIGNSIKNLRELAGMSSNVQEECDMIERSAKYSQLLLRRLLDYLDMGKPQVEPVDTLELLKRTELLARPRLPSDIRLEITVDQSMKNRIVSANVEQLMGVLLELIHNATNALHKNGGTIELKLEERGGEIAIFVKDDGPGIPMKIREKLFKEHVSSQKGLGVGLFLSNKVVDALGGKLKLQSSSRKGTAFTILLPTASDKKES